MRKCRKEEWRWEEDSKRWKDCRVLDINYADGIAVIAGLGMIDCYNRRREQTQADMPVLVLASVLVLPLGTSKAVAGADIGGAGATAPACVQVGGGILDT
jgi:hypothetical protein